MYQQLEQILLRGAADLQSGRAPDVPRIINALERIQPAHHRLATVIAAYLKGNNPMLQVPAALALARLKGAASAQVPALLELAGRHIPGGPSAAALSSLGAIATSAAIQGLINSLHTHPRRELRFVVGALQIAGSAAIPAIDPLKQLLRDPTLSPADRQATREALAQIHSAARTDYAQSVQNATLFEYIQIPPPSGEEHPNASKYFSTYSTNLDLHKVGLLHHGRFRFHWNNRENQLGLRIYGLPIGETLVVFAVDGESFGVAPSHCAEDLATAVLHIYNLPPERTIWLEYYATSSGHREEYCQRVYFNFEPKSGIFASPRWQRTRSLWHFLREHGIEG
ncbi:MAG: hypothetical protein EBZ48_04635 [Proteobacteria bacterium]|nr:hypothetical protein [Pseudomonadota bacterium]